MAKRGRKSTAQLAVVKLPGGVRRPEPPAELTEEQATEWRAVVDHMPGDWFKPEVHGLLAAYCRHIVRARFLSLELDRFLPEWLLTDDGPKRYNSLSASAERESRAALALARSMRITHQARQDPKTAYRRHQSAPAGMKRPWE